MKFTFTALSMVLVLLSGCNSPEDETTKLRLEIRKEINRVNNCREYCNAPPIYLKEMPTSVEGLEVLEANLRNKYWACRRHCAKCSETSATTGPTLPGEFLGVGDASLGAPAWDYENSATN